MLQNCPQTLNLPLLTANSEELTASDLRKDCYKVQKLQTSLEEKGKEKKNKTKKKQGKNIAFSNLTNAFKMFSEAKEITW